MRLALWIVSTVVGGLVLALAVALVRFNRKRLRIARIAGEATDNELELIYRLVEETTLEVPSGCVLGRTNRMASDRRSTIGLPHGLEGFPWSGRGVVVEASPEVTFRFTADPGLETQLAGRVFRAVRVPRIKLSSGKVRNVFSPRRYVSGSNALAAALRDLCPEWPDALLSYLLCVGSESFEFEPIDQARIGTMPAWVQDPEWPICEQCNRRLTLILQIPGTLLSVDETRGTFYWFGCKRHTESTKVVEQFT